MISTSVFTALGVLAAIGIILPVGAAIWWIRKYNEKVSTVLVGAATWFLFAIILETLPKLVLFSGKTAIGRTVLGNIFLYTLLGTLLAGVFEETGRLVAFKTVLKNRKNRETSIAHGIGHGGFEAMYILLSISIQYIIYGTMINAGTYQTVIDSAAAAGTSTASLEALPGVISSWTMGMTGIWIAERIIAMLLHAGLSIMVFYAVKKSRYGLYVLAIILHMAMDTPAALYQCGVIGLYLTEAILAAITIVFFVIVWRTLYSADREPDKAPAESGQV